MTTHRITDEDIRAAIASYERALTLAGLNIVGSIELVAPYGQVLHVVRTHPTEAGVLHDLPGFGGSTCGFTSKREAYEAIHLATRVIRDMTHELEALDLELSL